MNIIFKGMEAIDLKVDNLLEVGINQDGTKCLGKVLTIVKESNSVLIEVFDGNRIFNLKDIKPIKLTEEWLHKLGYSSRYITDPQEPNATKKFESRFTPIYFISHPERKEDVICFLHNCSCGNIKFVHQLQNLYFALTGEELTLKQ